MDDFNSIFGNLCSNPKPDQTKIKLRAILLRMEKKIRESKQSKDHFIKELAADYIRLKNEISKEVHK